MALNISEGLMLQIVWILYIMYSILSANYCVAIHAKEYYIYSWKPPAVIFCDTCF